MLEQVRGSYLIRHFNKHLKIQNENEEVSGEFMNEHCSVFKFSENLLSEIAKYPYLLLSNYNKLLKLQGSVLRNLRDRLHTICIPLLLHRLLIMYCIQLIIHY